MSTPAQPSSSGSSRPFIIAAVILVLLLVGYCAVKVVSLGRTYGHTVMDAAKGLQARTDTTHHVASGSAVYLGDRKIVDIVRVVVIHADTTTPATPTRGTLDSVMQAALRQQTVIYSSAPPASGADSAALNVRKLVGHVEGTFDADTPVKITLTRDTTLGTFSMPPVQLAIPGRRAPINVY
jgi:hypothetical protein